MAYFHRLIIVVYALFGVVVHAADLQCVEHEVPSVSSGTLTVTGNGWKPTRKEAVLGAKWTDVTVCGTGVATVSAFSESLGCKVGYQFTTANKDQCGPSFSDPGSYAQCAAQGFNIVSRSVNGDVINKSLPIGWYRVDDDGKADAGAAATAYNGLLGKKVCHSGRRHLVVEDGSGHTSVGATQNCYEAAGLKYCEVVASYDLVPLCEMCQPDDPGSTPGSSTKPDTDGDGDPDDTDPDIDGDGEPNNTDPDANGDGTPDGGGGDADGDGDPDSTDPDDDNDGCPDGQTCNSKPDADGDGTPDDTDTDDDNDGCLDVDEPCTPGQDSDGDGDPDSTDPDDDGDGCLDVNEPCSNDGGQCDPQTEDCSNTPGSFGGDCMAGFACSGDAIQCAIAREVHRRNCKLFDDKSPESELYNQNKGKNGDQTGDLPGNQTFNFMGYIKQINLLGGGAGFNDLTVDVYGKSITIPFTRINPFLVIFGNILVAVSLLAAVRIVGRA